MLQEFLFLAYLVLVQPYRERGMNKNQILNQIGTIVCIYCAIAIAMTDLFPLLQYNIGWCIILIFSLIFIVNSAMVFYKSLKSTWDYLYRKCDPMMEVHKKEQQKKHKSSQRKIIWQINENQIQN